MTHHIWLVYDRLTGQGPNPPGLRDVDLRDIRHRRAMRGTQSIPDPGPTRVLSRDEADAHERRLG